MYVLTVRPPAEPASCIVGIEAGDRRPRLKEDSKQRFLPVEPVLVCMAKLGRALHSGSAAEGFSAKCFRFRASVLGRP